MRTTPLIDPQPRKLHNRPELLEARSEITSVNFHRNVTVAIGLNQWLKFTMLRPTDPRLLELNKKLEAMILHCAKAVVILITLDTVN